MDTSNGVMGVLPNVSGQQVLNWVIMGLVGIIVLSVFTYIFWYYTKKKKYSQYRIEILDKDSNGNVYKTYDRGGVFLDKKTGLRLLFLENAKIGLNPNKIPYISHTDNKGRMIRTVYLRRIGVNNYVFIKMQLDEGVKFTVGEEDLNNAHQEMTKIRRIYNKESWLSKLAPYILFIVSMLLTMIVILSLFNKFGVIEQASKNMLEVTQKQAEITELLYNMTNSPAINPNIPIIVQPTPGGNNGK